MKTTMKLETVDDIKTYLSKRLDCLKKEIENYTQEEQVLQNQDYVISANILNAYSTLLGSINSGNGLIDLE